MSLTACLKKAGTSINPEDKARVLELARQYRQQGLSPDAAAIKAVDEQLLALQAKLDEAQDTLAAPTRDDVLAQQERAANADALDQREQVRKESEAGAGLFSLTMQDGRQDTTGSLFDQAADTNQEKASATPVAESQAPAPEAGEGAAARIRVGAGPVITDLGEKIGGARKDTAMPTGRAPRKSAEADDRPAWARRFQISQIVRAGGQIGEVRNEGRWVIRDTRSLDWMKQPKQVGRETFASREAAEKALPLLAVSMKHRVVPVNVAKPKTEADVDAQLKADMAAKAEDENRPGRIEFMVMQGAQRKLDAGEITQAQFDTVAEKYAEAAAKYTPPAARAETAEPTQAWEIWRDVSDRKRVKVVDLQFASRDDAMRYMAENAEAIIEANTTFGEADLPVPEDKRREGPQRREGDVKGQDFMQAFGFRGVEFGNWNNQDERQELMNEAYDGLMDLAEVMGIPPKAISLNGDLALAFGARGHGLSGARAHYEPDRAVMNLTKMKGAGALAHEWFHALDHYFGRQDGKAPVQWVTNKDGTRSLKVNGDFENNAVSSGFSRTNSGVREEVRAAVAKVMTTMARKAEQYVEDTAKTERFVAAVRNDVDKQLASIRRDLAEQKDVRYYKRNNKPATADQLAEFDAIAQRILAGEALDTELRSSGTKSLSGMRWTNDALEQISAIYKAVRGRSGFDSTNQSGILDRLRSYMGLYSQRLKMLAEAQAGAEKTKQIPTDFAMDARSLDQGRGTDYWTTPHEMAARAFQGYVEDKIAERGGKSPFLNYGPENAGILTPWGAKRPYPAGEERKAINAAFDELVKVIKTRETDQGVAMYARGAPVWRSALRDGVAGIQAKAQGADGWRAQIQGLVNKGAVKADEIEWSGVNDWLKLQTGKVTKEQVLEYLDGNSVQVQEVTLTAGGNPDETGEAARLAELEAMSPEDLAEQIESILGFEPDLEELRDDDGYRDDLIKEIMNEEAQSFDSRDGAGEQSVAKYQQYTLPGGQNYREVLLTLPVKGGVITEQTLADLDQQLKAKGGNGLGEEERRALSKVGGQAFEMLDDLEDRVGVDVSQARAELSGADNASGAYRSSHWDTPNVLAHIRVNDRTDAEGKRVLFVEEIQSDWGQEGKKRGFSPDVTTELPSQFQLFNESGGSEGVFDTEEAARARMAELNGRRVPSARDPLDTSSWTVRPVQLQSTVRGIPAAPFVTKTDGWLNLALKRVITMAAQEGYDRVAFVNGEQSADRYDLSKQVDRVTIWRRPDESFKVLAHRDGDTVLNKNAKDAAEVAELVGKDLADKAQAQARDERRDYTGLDLKVGGEGMKAFYDQIVPAAVKKLLPKVGGEKLMTVSIDLQNKDNNRYVGETFDPADAKVLQRGDVFQVWANGKLRGKGNYETREEAEAYAATGGRDQSGTQLGFDITPAMREKAAQGLPMFARLDAAAFRRAFGAPEPMGVDRAQQIVDELTRTWDNGPAFEIVATAADMPRGPHPSDARGLILNGTAYIVAANNPTRDAVARTLGHEAIGHYGLWKMLGEDGTKQFQRNLQLALASGNEPLGRIRDKVRRLYVDDAGKFNLTPEQEANEIAAFAVEEGIDTVTGEFRPGFGFLKSVWAKIAAFLRDTLGLPVRFTNVELQGLLVQSMRGLQAGRRLDGGAELLVAAARDVSPEGKALQALSENDDLFALPKSDKTTVEEIAAEQNPRIKVRKTKIGSETLYTLTMPTGDDAKLWVRPANPYGEQIYSMDLVDGDTSNVETGRPGENPEDVDPATEDVYLDVSNLKEGGHGNELYNIAATFAHNTGRIFIGDPSGLSDSAMRRRLENMISTALKFGTTDHIAPHPRQVKGDAKIGVPPLKWVYGDSLGNIRRMIDISLKAEETGDLPKYVYDPATGNLSPAEAGSRPLAEKPGPAGGGVSDVSGAPAQRGRTGARAAIFRALLREAGSGAQGDARGRDGLLARLVSVGNQFPGAVKGIFYARGPAGVGQPGVTTPARQGRAATNWRDSTGRLVLAPGKALYDLIGKAADPLLVRLQLKAASPELRRQLRNMKLEVQQAQDVAVAVARETQKLSEAERLMVSDIVEREVAAGTVPPAHAVRLAAVMNDHMGRQTDELIKLGMLSRETADRWRGQYLPRFYETKLRTQMTDAWADAVRGLGRRPDTLRGIKGKHLKGRGINEPVPAGEVEQWEALGWEVRDPDYPPGTKAADIARMVSNGQIQGIEPINLWRDYTRQERDDMGEIRDAGFRFVMGYMQTQKDIALGRMFEAMAADPESSSRLPREGWVHVPDVTIEGTGAKRYGRLSGRYVPRETLSHLTQLEEAQSSAWRMYRTAMGIWKEGKTALNPVAHVNNVVSNMTMAHFAGIGYHRWDKYLGAIKDLASGATLVKEARDAGLFLGTISDAELMNTLPPELQELARKTDSKTVVGARAVYNAMTFWLRKPMGAAYQAEDTFFRYLIYRDARQRNATPEEAVEYAQRYIFTYDDLPKGARMIRDFGLPFFAYTYKAVPALLNTALTRPDRFIAPAAVLWTANMAAYAIAAGDDDESWDEKLRKYLNDPEYRAKAREQEQLEREFLPPWMKGTTALMTPKTIRLGTDELTKLPLFLDTARIIPGGDLFDVTPNAGGIPLPQPITPSHPLITMTVGMLANKDLFLGKELVDANDDRGEAAAKRTAWIWKQMSPAIAVNNYHWERGMNALAQASGGEVKWMPDVLGGDATGIDRSGNPVQPKYAVMQTFGVKMRPIDLETAEFMDQTQRQKMVRDIDAEMRKLMRLNAMGAIPDRTLEKAYEKAQVKKERLMEGLTVDGDSR